MAVLLREIFNLYKHLNDDISDPRTKNWFLMSNPFPGLALLGFYLYVVFRLGPRLMQNRQPYELKNVLIIYNLVQVIACAYLVYKVADCAIPTVIGMCSVASMAFHPHLLKGLALGWGTTYRFICEPLDESSPRALEMAWHVCYGYFTVKFIDLLDTVFFVMRKKQNQVTFLHVYHHTGMVALSWGMVKWLPGGHGTFIVVINSFVHIVMYAYYLLTVYDESYKKSVWWKKHVTQLQIFQFAILLFHFTALVVVKDCAYPTFPSFILIPQNLFMVVLFSDFYYRSYIKAPPKNTEKSQ